MARQTQLVVARNATRGRPRKPSRRAPRRELDDSREDDTDESAQTANTRSIEVAPSTGAVTKAKEPESMLAQLAENEIVKMAAPLVGAAGGALAITVATERYGIKREVATFGGAALALAASQSVTGLSRDLLQAAATAGVCLGVVELLQTLRPPWLYQQQPVKHEPEHRQAAPPPDAITRSDLQQAMADLLKRNQADQLERDNAQAAQLQEVQALVRNLMTQLRDANSEVQRLREAEAVYLHEREVAAADAVIARNAAAYNEGTFGADKSAVDTFATQDESADVAIDATDESASADQIEEPASLSVGTPDGLAFPPDVVEHFAAIYALLDADEHRQLSSIVARLPKAELASAEAQLMELEPRAAVDYLRTTLFPSLRLSS